ncbi:MAG: hypothetical protein D6806_15195 [Deltaproteobacteria bacterium]|nr:MAG: hypothetical protein D6806_15195 [Deltaproteobacteria bacterium]
MRYVFDPMKVHECSKAGIGKPRPEMFNAIEEELEKAYPGRIFRDGPWIYSIAGGVMIQMKVLFASLMEYLIIWGTPIGSEGHSGRHLLGFWDTLLDGEMWYYAEGQFEKSVYKPGDHLYVGPFQARGMVFKDNVWAVEYARGPILCSLPFGLADEILDTLDISTAAQTLGVYMELVGKHWKNDAGPLPLLSLPRKLVGSILDPAGSALWRICRPAPGDDTPPAG